MIIHRRAFLSGLIAAPAIVSVAYIMPVRLWNPWYSWGNPIFEANRISYQLLRDGTETGVRSVIYPTMPSWRLCALTDDGEYIESYDKPWWERAEEENRPLFKKSHPITDPNQLGKAMETAIATGYVPQSGDFSDDLIAPLV